MKWEWGMSYRPGIQSYWINLFKHHHGVDIAINKKGQCHTMSYQYHSSWGKRWDNKVNILNLSRTIMMIMDTNMLSKVQLVYIEGYHEDFSTSSVCRWEGVARQQSQAWGGWKWKREQKTVGVWGESKRGDKWKGGGGVKRLKDNNRNPGLEEENEGWRENENWIS